MNIQEAITTEETTEFLKAANEFCHELELGMTSELDFCNLLFIEVSNLIFRASQLPNVELDNNQDFENRLTTDELLPILSRTSERLGQRRFYWTNFNPTDIDDMDLVAGNSSFPLKHIGVDTP